MSYALQFLLDLSQADMQDKERRIDLAHGIQHGLLKAGAVAKGKLREATTEGPVLARTGTLQRSWMSTEITDLGATAGGAAWQIEVLSRDPETGRHVAYENLIDQGGIVRPTHGKYLAIPINESVTARGVTRTGFESPRTAAGMLGQELTFVKNRYGKAFMGIAGKDGSFQAYYVLKEQVRISPRYYKQYARDRAEPVARQTMARSVADAMDKK